MKELEKKIPLEKMPGYHTDKSKSKKIGNITDLILKLRNTKLLDRFFTQSDPAWAGLTQLILDF